MSTTPIADHAALTQAKLAAQAPAELLAPFDEERRQLTAAGVPADVAQPGTPLPDADLVDAHGGSTTLHTALGGRPAVVVFYRGAWCPFCNLALRTYQAELVEPLAQRGAVLVAISPQKPDGSLTMQETNELTFTVLSDEGNKIAARLGILTEPTDGAKATQAALGLDVAARNADGTAVIPMPTTLVVDAGATIRWIDVHPDYVSRSEPAAILAAFDAVAQ
ncbi:peroxiredoxin-like family protein [Amycolatopsis rhabdoformis]|uniref:thioredoxin-dependent peroxiredoxin n=1 Tax=Amycolatopsis rhabdoformis TaxID=1448059 RepID=A0ABZ1IDR6_9PSEU|nr:peroxiredoxin-like family protein [Amycolatopsis rhabdoformis]WSE32609.1 peroxiredoxin-like family protein [Amycolatopsis rhabdoformis]